MIDFRKASPYLSGLAFAFIFGFSFLITKNTLGKMEVFQLLGIRFLIAFLVFEILRITKLVTVRLSLKTFRAILPVALFQPGLYFILEVYGVKNAESGEAGLMIGMIPVAVAILSRITLKEKMNPGQIAFMSMSLAGIVLIGITQSSGNGATGPAGYILLAGAVVSAAVYNILSRKSSFKYSPVEITYVMMLTGAVLFNAIGITDSVLKGYCYLSPMSDPSVLMSLSYLGILSSVVAFFCVNFTLSRIPAVQGAVFSNLVTVISIAAGALFLNETLSLYKVIGSLLIIAGVFGTNYFRKRKGKRPVVYT